MTARWSFGAWLHACIPSKHSASSPMALETTPRGSGSAELQITAVFWLCLLCPFPLPKLLRKKTSLFLAVFHAGSVTNRCCWGGAGCEGRWEAAFGLEFRLGPGKQLQSLNVCTPRSCPAAGPTQPSPQPWHCRRPRLSHLRLSQPAPPVGRPCRGRGEACPC